MYVCVHVRRQRYTVSSIHSTVHLNEVALPELIGFPRLKRFDAFSSSASSPYLVRLLILPSFTLSGTFSQWRLRETKEELDPTPRFATDPLRRYSPSGYRGKFAAERLAESSFTNSRFKSRTTNDLERTGLENVGIRRRIVSERDVLYPDSLRGPPLHSIIVGDVSLSVLTELGNQSYWISMHLLSNPVAKPG